MRTTTIGKMLWRGREALLVGAVVLPLFLRAVINPYHPPAPAAHLGALTVMPAQITLAAGSDTPSITIVGSGLPPNAALEFDLTCQTCDKSDGSTLPVPVATPGNNPRTDARGVVKWSGGLLLQTKPGTYVVEAHALHSAFLGEDAGGALARGTLTMRG